MLLDYGTNSIVQMLLIWFLFILFNVQIWAYKFDANLLLLQMLLTLFSERIRYQWFYVNCKNPKPQWIMTLNASIIWLCSSSFSSVCFIYQKKKSIVKLRFRHIKFCECKNQMTFIYRSTKAYNPFSHCVFVFLYLSLFFTFSFTIFCLFSFGIHIVIFVVLISHHMPNVDSFQLRNFESKLK